MKKLILILLIFFNILYAKIDISSNDNIPIYKTIEVSSLANNIEEAIKNPQNFEQVDYFIRSLRKKKTESSIWYKLDIYNSSNTILDKKILTQWNHTNIYIYLVDEHKNILVQEKLKKYNNFLLSNPFTIKPKQNLQLYLNVQTPKGVDDFYYLNIVSEDALNLVVQEKFFNIGIFLGLLLAMMLYSFFMYFAIRIKSYLYLGLYQLAIVIHLSDIRYFLITLLQDYQELSYILFKIVFSAMLYVFSILFTKEFLNTKETMPTINKLLTILLVFHIISEIFPYNNINYSGFLYGLYLVAGFISLRQGNKYALFFILGFTPSVINYFFVNVVKLFSLNIYVEYQMITLITTIIEAFALSMALYLKLKETVEEKEKAVQEVHTKEKMMLEQSKFAAMGEMIGNIAHQWRQPINNVSSILSNISTHYKYEQLTKEKLDSKINEANMQLKYMSSTIEDFMNFFSHNNKKTNVTLKEVCEEAFFLTKSSLEKHHILVNIESKSEELFSLKKKELIQVLVVFINNSKDAFVSNKIKDPMISLKVENKSIIYVDNAGGIPQDIINKIFEPYFTTKQKSKGTGIGLYIAKQIIESLFEGEIKVYTENSKTIFTIYLDKIKLENSN